MSVPKDPALSLSETVALIAQPFTGKSSVEQAIRYAVSPSFKREFVFDKSNMVAFERNSVQNIVGRNNETRDDITRAITSLSKLMGGIDSFVVMNTDFSSAEATNKQMLLASTGPIDVDVVEVSQPTTIHLMIAALLILISRYRCKSLVSRARLC